MDQECRLTSRLVYYGQHCYAAKPPPSSKMLIISQREVYLLILWSCRLKRMLMKFIMLGVRDSSMFADSVFNSRTVEDSSVVVDSHTSSEEDGGGVP